MKKIKIFTVFLIIVILAASPASALPALEIEAYAVLLAEMKSGNILWEYNKDIRVAPGSIAKVMTVLLAVLEVEEGRASLDDSVDASESFLSGLDENTVTQNIKPGETISYRDLLYCAYLASANDACNILAEEVSGSIRGFVRKMNEKAEELGCRNTYFMNPGGLADPGQYTSAWDQYLIFKEAVGHPLFLEIAGRASYVSQSDADSPERVLVNPNLMLQRESGHHYAHCVAGKTAHSSEYGSSFVAYADNGELSLISVVFGVKSAEGDRESNASECFSETQRLLEWGMSNFAWRDIVTENEIAAYEDIALAKGIEMIGLKPAAPITILARNDLTAQDIEKDIIIYGKAEGKVLSAPVKKGEILGEISVSIDGTACGQTHLVAAHDAKLDKSAFIRSEIADTLSLFWVQLVIFLLVVFAAYYIWLVMRDFRRRREKKRRAEEHRRKMIEYRRKQTIKK
jgi:D-alanyl-D-alanine carboxypeptidase (penicillin-binding protein 5/6)